MDKNYSSQIAGIIGLSKNKSANHKLILDNLRTINVTSAKFSINFPRLENWYEKEDKNKSINREHVGDLILGHFDSSLLIGSIKSYADSSAFGWNILANMTLGEFYLCENCVIYFDPNLDGIQIPSIKHRNVQEGIFAAFSAGKVSKKCCNLQAFPSLNVISEDGEFVLLPEEYIEIQNDEDGKNFKLIFTVGEKIILGRQFMTKYFVEFDYKSNLIGFAEKKIIHNNSLPLFASSSTFLLSLFILISILNGY